jgi:hypothetical protein
VILLVTIDQVRHVGVNGAKRETLRLRAAQMVAEDTPATQIAAQVNDAASPRTTTPP